MVNMLWIIGAVAFAVLAGVLMWLRDKRIWNNGVCRENGEKWVLFDRDSQGGYGLKAGDVRRWISWISPVLDKQ